MQTRSLILSSGLAMLLLVGTALAQPGGGRPDRATPPGGGGRPTRDAAFPMPTITQEAVFATGTRAPELPAVTRDPSRGTATQPSALPTRTAPGVSASGNIFASATFVPQGTLESAVQELQQKYDLNITDNFPPSSAEAEAMLTAFSSEYFGTVPTMVYAAQVDTSSLSYDTLSQLLLSFPSDISDTTTALIQSMQGTAYGGLYQNADGLAMLYTGTCSGAACSTTQGQLQFVLQQGALALYGTYVDGTVADANAALNLIYQYFPLVKNVSLSAPTTEVDGYSFVGQTTQQVNRTTTTVFYYVGTYSTQKYTLVYAIVGIGDVYTELIKP